MKYELPKVEEIYELLTVKNYIDRMGFADLSVQTIINHIHKDRLDYVEAGNMFLIIFNEKAKNYTAFKDGRGRKPKLPVVT